MVGAVGVGAVVIGAVVIGAAEVGVPSGVLYGAVLVHVAVHGWCDERCAVWCISSAAVVGATVCVQQQLEQQQWMLPVR